MRRAMMADNFLANCDQSSGPDGCWPYLGSRCSNGYGTIWVKKRVEAAHRYSYMLAKGPIPLGPDGKTMHVLHHCDNPPCCNPTHLYLGTSKRNAQDREERNRGNHAVGEAVGASVLRTKDIIFIKRCRDIYNSREMAAMLGVKPAIISKILNGQHWAHVVVEPQGLSECTA